MAVKEFKVDYLARVEGEGGLYIKLVDGEVKHLEVRIFEAPRFFEAFLRGRKYTDAPDITARICGICPVAYQMSSGRAMEKILGIEVPDEIKKLRRILYLSEWIESHVLHIFLLHAPDFLGYESSIQMAKDHPDIVKKALKLKGWGNKGMEIIGGRPVHPVSPRVGGFHRIIRKEELLKLLKNYNEIKAISEELFRWVLDLPMPDLQKDYEFVSLKSDKEYPILEGWIASNKGLNAPEDKFEEVIAEEQAPYSTALRYKVKGRGPYLTGPLARFNLNYDMLLPEVRSILEERGIKAPLYNPYQSIIARAAETHQAVLEIEELINNYREPAVPYVEAEVKAGWAAAITEAPRGMLYHAYEIDENGYIKRANIVSPTAQNLACMETDLLAIAPKLAEMEYEKALWLAEQTIRNYDPCISCSAHFLKLKIEKE
jgi:coenzyme F420-reducing hydrogenase alpha subunit